MEEALRFFQDRGARKTPRKVTRVEDATVIAHPGSNLRGGNAFRHTKTGFRTDLDLVCRSGWEANVMRILTAYGIEFDFEPMVFTFPLKRGIRGYTPDIFLPKTQEWIEVKGFFDDASRIKIKRFRIYHPDHFANLTVITGKKSRSIEVCEKLGVPRVLFYDDLSRLFKEKIINWEGR